MAILKLSQKQKFEEQGIHGHALEMLLKETARDRHLSRVEDAMVAAIIAATNDNKMSKVLTELILDKEFDNELIIEKRDTLTGSVGICILELAGIGGGIYATGTSTERHPAFSILGKGRKKASDGPAWTAAIRDAMIYIARAITKHQHPRISVRPSLSREDSASNKDSDGALSVWINGYDIEIETLDILPFPVINGKKNMNWHYTLAREGLRVTTIQKSVIKDLHGVHFDGTPAEWAVEVNELIAAMAVINQESKDKNENE